VSGQFATELFLSNHGVIGRESAKYLGLWQLLLFDGVTCREENGEKVHGVRGVN